MTKSLFKVVFEDTCGQFTIDMHFENFNRAYSWCKKHVKKTAVTIVSITKV